MAVCPGAPIVQNNPTTLVGVTQTPNVPADIFSANGTDPFPSVAWPPADEFCSFEYTFTPGHEFITPAQNTNLAWRDGDNSIVNDTTSSAPGSGLVTGLGSTAGSSTPITGPVSSGFIPFGTDGNTVQVTIVSGTVRVGMSNGSLFGYNPGDPVSNAVIRYEWTKPIHNLRHDYFDHGTDETPTGYTNYRTSLAVASSPSVACVAADNIGTTHADIHGQADQIPVTEFVRLSYGTTPGGPYTNQGTLFPGTMAPQFITTAANTLAVGTTYYYVLEHIASDSTTVLQTSSECNFTTVLPTGMLSNCNLLPRGRNGVEFTFDVDTAGTGAEDNDFNHLEGEYSTDGGTTWFPIPVPNDGLVPGGDIAVPAAFAAFGEVVWPFVAGQSVLVRVHFLVDNTIAQTLTCGPTNTNDYPVVACSAGAITTTSADITFTATNPNGAFNAFPAGVNDPQNQDTIRVVYGTTPGGPYPFVAQNGFGPTVSLAGLIPNTQYYYRMQADEQFQTAGQFLDFGECTFTTLAATVNPECNPATFIQATQADLQGTVDNLVGPNKARIEVGTTPGGPYPIQSGDTAGDNTVDQLIPPVPFAATGLSAGTYYYRVAVYTGSNTFLEASSECSFVIPASTVDCAPATNIQATMFTANGVAHNVLTNWDIILEFGTTPGGPYPNQQFFGNGDGTANQPLSNVVAGLAPNTTYYYRWTVFDEIANNVYTGPECAAVQTQPDQEATCSPATNVDNNSADLNGTVSGAIPGDQYRFRYGTTPGGPYGSTIGPFPAVNGAVSQPTGDVLAAGTTYYFIVEVLDSLNTVVATSGECNFATVAADPPVTNPPANISSTGGDGSGQGDFIPPNQQLCIAWGTTPGGPYPNTACCVAGTNSADQNVGPCPLGPVPPGTQICFRTEIREGGDVVQAAAEQCFFTTNIIIDPCEAATNVTPVSATLNGTSQNVPAGYSYQFRYGTTPGGPYPNVVSGGPSSGGSPDPYSANVIGLTPCTTYYYTSEVLNPAQQVVAGGGECSFTSECASGPGGFVYWCGALYDSANCIFVDTENDDYWNCSGADSIDDV